MNRKPALIAGVVGLVVVVGMLVGLILPKAGQVRERQRQVQAAQQQEGALRTQLEQLQAAAKEAPKDRRTLARLERQIPPTADLPGLIRLLNDTSNRSGVDFMTVSPGQPVSQGNLSAIPVQINVVGGFFAVDEYLRQLERLPRVSKVTTISVAAGPSGLPQLSVNLTATFYTTDTSAGPGSIPGGAGLAPQPAATPTVGG